MSSEENQSLLAMLGVLKSVERVIDTTEDEITLEMCEAHFAQFKSVQEKTDSLVGYMSSLKMMAAQLAEKAETFKHASKVAEKRLERLEEYAIFCLGQYPNLSGTDYELTTRLNPASLKCDAVKSFSKSNVIPDNLVLDIPEEYRDLLAVWVLKTDKVKDDLKAGKALPWARLEQKTKLVTKPKLKGLSK